jgi:hypothetical protein
MNFDPKAYRIGDTVKVTHELERRLSLSGMITWEPKIFRNSNAVGIIVGVCIKQDGKRQYSGSAMDDVFGSDECYFEASATHKFWLVRYGLMNKPIIVRECDITSCEPPQGFKFPLKAAHRWPMSEDQKEALSRESKTWPRDEKGRWSCGPCIHAT